MAGPGIFHTGRTHNLPAVRLPRQWRRRKPGLRRPSQSKRRNHDNDSCLSHFFFVPGGVSTGATLANFPRTTSMTGVLKFAGFA
jgi:hypothetical protein